MTKSANYEINHIDETIIITKKFYKAAGILNSPEYKELMAIRRDNPNYKIVLREIKKKAGKKSYRNLTYDNMKTFITAWETDEETRKQRLAQMDTVMELSKVQAGPYAYVKTWFLDLYGEAYNKYNDDTAEQSESEAA